MFSFWSLRFKHSYFYCCLISKWFLLRGGFYRRGVLQEVGYILREGGKVINLLYLIRSLKYLFVSYKLEVFNNYTRNIITRFNQRFSFPRVFDLEVVSLELKGGTYKFISNYFVLKEVNNYYKDYFFLVVKDKVVLQCVKIILQFILEGVFLGSSYGFFFNYGCHNIVG